MSRGLLLVALTVASGCGDVLSSEVETDRMRAEVELRSWADGSAAMGISMKTFRPTRKWVELDTGDTIVATLGDLEVPMHEEVLKKKHTYVAWFNDIGVGDEIGVELRRDSGDDALASVAALPPSMDMTLSSDEIDIGWEGVEVQWWPVGTGDDDMELEVTGPCINNFKRKPDDSGSYFIGAGAFDSFDEDDPISCTVEIELRRVRTGQLDDAFRSGEARGVVIRNTTLWVDAFGYQGF